MNLLIVNADDFGLNSAVNAGIIECHKAGSVTSTTLMANAPAYAQAVGLAMAHPSLGVGLHFNLTWGSPLNSPELISTLVDQRGEFLSQEALARRILFRFVNPRHVELELAAQFERLHASGINPTHIDSHQHMHAFPLLFSEVARYCLDKEIPMRVPWVQNGSKSGWKRRIRRAILSKMVNQSAKRWSGAVRWNDGLVSVFDLGMKDYSFNSDHYRQLLDLNKGSALELMVHPVISAAEMIGYTEVGEVGEAEYQWLRSGAVLQLAAESGFRLGSYRDL